MSKDIKQHVKFEEDIPCGDLEIDPEIQRTMVNENKIIAILANFNPMAVGRILVSRRKDGSQRILDGWHRKIVIARLTDNKGTVPCEVYTGLSKQEEAQLFLDKNMGDKPNLIERYRVSVIAGDADTVAIDQIVHSHGWKVANGALQGSGYLACVMALYRLYRFSERNEHEPNLLDMALRAIDRAWGDNTIGGQGHIITGVGRVIGEYGDLLNWDHLIDKLRNYKGGVERLNAMSRQYANIRRQRLPMAVAELIVEEYNKGLGDAKRLRKWARRG